MTIAFRYGKPVKLSLSKLNNPEREAAILGLPESVLTDADQYTQITLLGLKPIDRPITFDSVEAPSKSTSTLFERLLSAETNEEKASILSPVFDKEPDFNNVVAKLKGHLVGSLDGSNFILEAQENYHVETLVHLQNKKIVALNVVESLPDDVLLHELGIEHSVARFLRPVLVHNLDSYHIEVFHVLFQPGQHHLHKQASYIKLSDQFSSTIQLATFKGDVYVLEKQLKLSAYEKAPEHNIPIEMHPVFLDYKNILLPHVRAKSENGNFKSGFDAHFQKIAERNFQMLEVAKNDKMLADFYAAAYTKCDSKYFYDYCYFNMLLVNAILITFVFNFTFYRSLLLVKKSILVNGENVYLFLNRNQSLERKYILHIIHPDEKMNNWIPMEEGTDITKIVSVSNGYCNVGDFSSW